MMQITTSAYLCFPEAGQPVPAEAQAKQGWGQTRIYEVRMLQHSLRKPLPAEHVAVHTCREVLKAADV